MNRPLNVYKHSKLDLPAQQMLESYVAKLQNLFVNDLVGIYIYGSVALGAYKPESSDIDVTVIHHNDLTEKQRISLKNIHEELLTEYPTATKLDVNYIPLRLLGKPGENSLPYAREGQFHSSGGGDVNITMWHILHTKGITLYGSPSTELIPSVDPIALAANMRYNLEFLEKRMPYYIKEGTATVVFGILGLCRVIHTLKTHEVAGKIEAGKWALNHVDSFWHPLIERAIKLYESHDYSQRDELLQSEALQFASYINKLAK